MKVCWGPRANPRCEGFEEFSGRLPFVMVELENGTCRDAGLIKRCLEYGVPREGSGQHIRGCGSQPTRLDGVLAQPPTSGNGPPPQRAPAPLSDPSMAEADASSRDIASTAPHTATSRSRLPRLQQHLPTSRRPPPLPRRRNEPGAHIRQQKMAAEEEHEASPLPPRKRERRG